ncbi:HBA2 protein, partial [Casuarius casuarius]|nr:HBA2 protein [Casuarius casuarius]
MLTADDRKVIPQVWERVMGHQEAFRAKTLERMFMVYPQTKTYFPHFDLHHGSDQIHSHGKKVMNALGNTVKNLDGLSQAMSELSNLRAYNLRVDPGNFKASQGPGRPGAGQGAIAAVLSPVFALQLLSQCFQVVLAVHLGKDYTPEVHSAFDKFLAAMASVLAEKYR